MLHPRTGRLFVLSLLMFLAALPAAFAKAPEAAQAASAEPAPAILTVDPRSNASVTWVNDMRLRGALRATGSGVRQLTLRPGDIVLDGDVATESGLTPWRVRWDFEPGKSYVVYASLRGYGVQVKIAERGAPRPDFDRPVGTAERPAPAPDAAATAPAAPDASPGSTTAAPATQEATLKLEQDLALTVQTIDGKSAIGGGWWRSEYPREFKLPPGKHRLQIQLTIPTPYPGRIGYSHLWFVAEPGREYFVRSTSRGTMFGIWIEDDAGFRIGGIVGSDDEPRS